MKSNRSSNYRHKWFWVDFCYDGLFKKPRIKGKNKRFLRKKSIKRVQKEFEKE